MEEAFDKIPGVISAMSGYTGGTVDEPTYEQVSSKTDRPLRSRAGDLRSAQGQLPPARRLVLAQHRSVDATGQFCDKGSPYHTAIFVHDDAQKKVAEESKQALEASGRLKEKIATKILPAGRSGRPRTITRTTTRTR